MWSEYPPPKLDTRLLGSEPVVRESIVQVDTELAPRAVLFKRRASLPLIIREQSPRDMMRQPAQLVDDH